MHFLIVKNANLHEPPHSTDTGTHGQMDGQTHKKRITSVPPQKFFLLICEGEGGKLYKPFEISTSPIILFELC